MDRNLVMIEGMKRVLSGEEVQDKGKKPVKPQDLARLYETIIQVYLFHRVNRQVWKWGRCGMIGRDWRSAFVNLKSNSALLYNKGHN